MKKTSVYAPDDIERLRADIELMAPRVPQVTVRDGDSVEELQRTWLDLYNNLPDDGIPEIARVKVWNDYVVETFNMDAAYATYGHGAPKDAPRTPWCGNRSRSLYESYGGGGLRRFNVLPNGPSHWVEIDGQRVPTAKDAYTFAINSSGKVNNCNDYANRYMNRGLDVENGLKAAKLLEETFPDFDVVSWFEQTSLAVDGLSLDGEEIETWTDYGFTIEEIPTWIGFLTAMGYVDTDAGAASAWQDVCDEADRALAWYQALSGHEDKWLNGDSLPTVAYLRGEDWEPQEVAQWIEFFSPNDDDWRELEKYKREGFHPQLVKALNDGIKNATDDTADIASVDPDDLNDFFKHGFNGRDFVEAYELFQHVNHDMYDLARLLQVYRSMGWGFDDVDNAELADWIGHDLKRRKKWVTTNNIEPDDERLEILKDLKEGDSPHAYLSMLDKLTPEQREVADELGTSTRVLRWYLDGGDPDFYHEFPSWNPAATEADIAKLGGVERARKLLSLARRTRSNMSATWFIDMLAHAPEEVLDFLQSEHPLIRSMNLGQLISLGEEGLIPELKEIYQWLVDEHDMKPNPYDRRYVLSSGYTIYDDDFGRLASVGLERAKSVVNDLINASDTGNRRFKLIRDFIKEEQTT